MKTDQSKYPLLTLFDCLNDNSLENLSIKNYQPKEVLIRKGSCEQMCLYLLLEGICVNKQTVTDNDYSFSSRKFIPGEFIGLIELITPSPTKRYVSVIAKTPVTALEIKGHEFRQWQSAYPALYNTVISQVLRQQFFIRDIQFHCASINSLTAGAYYLSHLYDSYLTACYPSGYTGPVKIWDTRQEIGSAIARDTRSVDRIISEFLHLGFVSVHKAKLHINAGQAKLLKEYMLQRS